MMIYNFKEIIAFISKYITLEPRDLILTGTLAPGVGKNIKGDLIQVSLEGELLIDYKIF